MGPALPPRASESTPGQEYRPQRAASPLLRSGRGVYAVDGQNMLSRHEIPEPSTLILLGLGLTAVGEGVIHRRRKA